MRVERVVKEGTYIRHVEVHFKKAITRLDMFTVNDIVEGFFVRDWKSGRFIGFGRCDGVRTVITEELEYKLGGSLLDDGRIRISSGEQHPRIFKTPFAHICLRLMFHKKLEAIVGISLSPSSAEKSCSNLETYRIPPNFAIRLWYDKSLRGIEFNRLKKCISYGFGFCYPGIRSSHWFTNEGPSCFSHRVDTSMPICILSSWSSSCMVLMNKTYGNQKDIDKYAVVRISTYLTPGKKYSFRLSEQSKILMGLIPQV